MPDAKLRRDWVLLWLGVLMLIGLGMLTVACNRGTVPQSASATPTIIKAGTSGYLKGHEGTAIIWVDDIGYSALKRAYANRDDRGMLRVFELYEHIEVSEHTRVRVTERRGDAIQVEVLSGPDLGRRGWTDASTLIPS